MDQTPHAVRLRPPDPEASGAQHRRALIIIALLVLLVGYFDLGRREMLNSLEIGYAVTVQEMVRDGNWVVPTLNGRPRLVKPPLPFWVGAGVCTIIHGDHAPIATLRAVSVGVGIIAAWLVYALGCRMFDRRAALWAAIVWATCFLAVYEIRYARHDIYLVAGVHLAMLGLFKCWMRERFGWLIALAGMTLAFQCKGPVSWALTVLPTVVFALINRPVRWRFIGAMLLAGLLAGMTLLPWLAAVGMSLEYNTMAVWKWEAVGRFASEAAPFAPPWFYLQFVGYVAPWTVYFIAAMIVPFERKYAARREPMRFAWLWLVVGLAFMSLPYEKTSRYVVPLIAPAALLIGQILSFHIDLRRRNMRDPKAGGVWVGHAIFLLCSVAGLPIAAAIAFATPMWAAVVMGIACALPVGYCTYYLTVRRDAWRGSIAATVAAVALVISLFAANQYAPGNRDALRDLVPKLQATLGPDEMLVSWPNQPPLTLVYHANRAAPTITNWFVAQELLADHDDADLPTQRENREAYRQRILSMHLQHHADRTIFILVDGDHRGQLLDRAQAMGRDAQVALDMTTPTPRKPDKLRELYLVRIEPRVDSTDNNRPQSHQVSRQPPLHHIDHVARDR